MKLSKTFVLLFVISFVYCNRGISQIVNLPCQDENVGVIDLDRNDWENPPGSTGLHSQGTMHNFTLPTDMFGPCKKIEQIEINIDFTNVDASGLPAGCGVFAYFTNIYLGCPSFAPASCNLFAQSQQPNANDQTITYNCPPFSFDFGDVLGVDIVPAMDPPSCAVFQTALSSGALIVEYDICIIVTIGAEMINIPVDIGPPSETVCESVSTLLDAGSYDQYMWVPNNENSQTINATGSPGGTTYAVTVTDINGCTDTDEITITESIPTVNITSNDPDNTICSGETVILTANTTQSDILWSTNQSSTSISVFPSPTPYTVTVTDINGCEATASIQIDEHPATSVNLVADMTTVCGTGLTTITASPGFIDYDWDNGDMDDVIVVGAGNYTLIVTDINGCEATESIQIFQETPPNAGTATDMSVCNDGTTYNIDGNLGVHDFGGDWSDMDGVGIDIGLDPFNTSFLGITPGIYNFEYTVFGTAPCLDDSETITIEVVQGADAGSSNSITICSDDPPVNFYTEISTADLSGFWTESTTSGADLSDPTSVDFSSVPNGNYIFNYEVIATFPCNSAMSTLEITVDAAANAGGNVTVSVCEGADYNLFDALDVSADLGGTFTDDSGTSALTGSNFNTIGFSGQSPMFTYSVGSANCGSDQVVVTVEVVSAVSAGDNTSGNVFCVGENIDLFDVLNNEDAGGTFTSVPATAALIGNTFDTQISGSGSFTITYQIGDNIICPLETAEIGLEIIEPPTIAIQGMYDLCPNDCQEISVAINGQGALNFDLAAFEAPNVNTLNYSGAGNSGNVSVWVCNGDQSVVSNDTMYLAPNPLTWMLIPNTVSNNQCTNQFVNTDTVFVNTFESYSVLVDDPICADDSITVGTFVFNAANPFGSVTLSSLQGCDSIVEVNLNILDVGKLVVNSTLCTGDDIMIGGIIFDEANPSDTLVITDGSVSGCDSIIEVNLSFVQSFNTNDELFICQGDSVLIDNVWVKDEGSYIDNLVSVQLCDSIVNVELMHYPPAESTLNPVLCEGGMIIINGTLYDENNQSGTQLLSKASVNGCDSIINVAVSFSTEIIIDLSREICTGDSTQVDGIWYFDNTTVTEIETTNSGCDSTTNTTINVFPESIFNLTQELCDDGSIIVNGTVYNEGNPSGIETFLNEDINGCDSTVIVSLSFVDEIMETDQENICEGDSIFLAGAWQFDAGEFVDMFTTVNGCDSLVTTTVIVDACFDLGTVEIIDNVCAEDANGSICVTVESGSVPIIVRWENTNTGETGNIQISTTGNQFCESSLLSGDYTIEYFSTTGVSLAIENYVIQDINPPLEFGPGAISPPLCFGNNNGFIEIEVIGGTGVYTYNWTPSLGNGPRIENLEPGIYEVLVTDSEQCEISREVEITELDELELDVEFNNSTCDEIANGSISITPPDIALFILTVNGSSVDAPYELTDLTPGVYEVILQLFDLPCMVIKTVIIENDGTDILSDFTDSYQVELGDSVTFLANYPSTVDSVIWFEDSSISCTNCFNPTFQPESNATYSATVFDESGCTQQMNILVNVIIPEVDVFVPNVFSPNDDGLNDVFLIGFSNVVSDPYSLSVFDRWGNRVYEEVLEPNSQEGWDGKYNLNDVVPGVYLYVVRYMDPNRGEVFISGNITVL